MWSDIARCSRFSVLLLMPLLASCGGDDITGVTVNATLRVVLDDNPSRTTPPVSGTQQAPPPGDYTGTLATTTRVAVSSDGESWHELIGTQALNIPLQVGDSAVVERTVSLPAATYSQVRLTLRGASMTVTGDVPGGSVSNRPLDISELEVVIVRPIPAITVSANTSARVAFDLNTENWLTSANVTSGTIAGSQLQAAIQAVAGYEGS